MIKEVWTNDYGSVDQFFSFRKCGLMIKEVWNKA